VGQINERASVTRRSGARRSSTERIHVEKPNAADATSTAGDQGGSPYAAARALHDRCGIYTKTVVVRRILDAIQWRERVDLSSAKLLEPAAGDGAFLVEAARRLVASLRRLGIHPTLRVLGPRIVAYELHRPAAHAARRKVVSALREAGIDEKTAARCAQKWVLNRDFLLASLRPELVSHVAGNPPYVRWSKIPTYLRARYDQVLADKLRGGDLFIPFLDRSLTVLASGGRFGFVCSDRWKYSAFASAFRAKWGPLTRITSETRISSRKAFAKPVHSYPSITIGVKRAGAARKALSRTRGKTLEELGCSIRVGPALGGRAAYVIPAGPCDVELELLHPWVRASDIKDGRICSSGHRVVAMHDSDGDLLPLRAYPLLGKRLRRFQTALSGRSIVALRDRHWYRPIDRIRAEDWSRPKILVPELARKPRCAIDRSGAIPAHGVYAIFAHDDNVDRVYAGLKSGRLGRAIRKIAPQVNGGYWRCYKRFLSMIRIRVDD
jgi:hypothetical protein